MAAAIGGTAWTVKAVVTLVSGDEPPAAFAIGFALFPFALLGLWSLVRKVDGRASPIGGAVAATAAASVVLAALIRAVGGAGVEPSEDEITVLTPFIAIGGFGTLAALLMLGVAVRRSGALAAPPDPFGPMRPTRAPAATRRSTAARTVRAPWRFVI